MDEKGLDGIKAREQAATPGPWYYNITETAIDSKEKCVVTPEIDGQEFPIVRMKDEDADFIAHARTDIPELISEVERLTKDNATLTEKLKKTAALAGKWDDQLLAEDKIIDSLKAKNATLKKALELACGWFEQQEQENGSEYISEEIKNYFIQQAQEQEEKL